MSLQLAHGPTTPARGDAADEIFSRKRQFIDDWLDRLLPAPGCSPTRLHLAMRDSVFPGGKRARALLCCLVADACEQRSPEMVGRMAAAVELVHCASLVHDDLPAFDDAPLRRGKPSCHAAFGEPTAILVGDALLTLAFEVLALAPMSHAGIAMQLVALLSQATGSRSGIIGGQGLELQTNVDLAAYHQQKTAALFRAAAGGGAIAVGAEQEVERWSRFGELVGRALQLRDDLDDVFGTPELLGKPVGRDAQGAKPNAVHSLGAESTVRRLEDVVGEAIDLLGPVGEWNAPLRQLVARIGRPRR